MSHMRRLPIWKLFVAVPLLAGCSSNVHFKPPAIDAYDAAERAMELYDSDGSGDLDASELKNAPSLQAAMTTIDTDSDGKASTEEIAKRIEAWQATKAAVCVIDCVVSLDKKPLDAATITFEPAEFLKDQLCTAVAYTDDSGRFSPSIPKKDRPTKGMPFGMQFGFFKVRISKEVDGKETIPAKFNTETTLGQQVAADDPAIIRQKIVFSLKSK